MSLEPWLGVPPGPHAGLAQPTEAGCDQGQLGHSASELQNPPNVVVKEEQTGKGKGAQAVEGSRTHAWTGVGPSQEATPPSPPLSPAMLAPWPWKSRSPAGTGEKSKARWLTLAPFWAGGSTLPSGLKTMPGSPFSP